MTGSFSKFCIHGFYASDAMNFYSFTHSLDMLFFLRLIEEFYTSHCRQYSQLRAAMSNTVKSPLQLCSGHSLAMCCALIRH